MSTKAGGGLGGMLKSAVFGATAFIIDFTPDGEPGQVAFSAGFPGKILPIELEGGQFLVMQKHAFLCAEQSVALDDGEQDGASAAGVHAGEIWLTGLAYGCDRRAQETR